MVIPRANPPLSRRLAPAEPMGGAKYVALRLVVPWKYSSKGIESVVKFTRGRLRRTGGVMIAAQTWGSG